MIEKVSFFEALTPQEAKRLEAITVAKKYKKGEILFLEGEEPKWLIFLLTGSVKLYKTAPSGKEIFLHQLAPMNFVAEVVNFENIPYPASAAFAVSGEVLKILSNPKICLYLLKSMSQKLRITSNLLHQELVLNAEAKVAKFIVMHEDLFNSLRHTKIASILNITPETLSRILNKFKSSNLIKLDEKNQLILKDEAQLSEMFSC